MKGLQNGHIVYFRRVDIIDHKLNHFFDKAVDCIDPTSEFHPIQEQKDTAQCFLK